MKKPVRIVSFFRKKLKDSLYILPFLTLFSLSFTVYGQSCDYLDCTSVELVKWNMQSCDSNTGGSNADYSELTPIYPNSGGYTSVTATNLWRDNGNHSCTPGHDGNPAMCIGIQYNCIPGDYDPSWALKFETTLNPSDVGHLTNLQFYEKAPYNYDWIGGASGPNDYPLYYLIRVYKNNQLIYSQNNIATQTSWNLESFDFSSNPSFAITSTSTFRFELRGYCKVGNGASNSVWDIDDVSIKGCSGSMASNCSITPTVSNITCDNNGTPSNSGDDLFDFDLTVQGNECTSPNGWETVINGTTISGDYGVSTHLSSYPIVGGELNLIIQDKGTTSCNANVTVTPPTTCSDSPDCEDVNCSSVSLAKWNMEACDSNTGGSNADYSEFTPTYPNNGGYTSVFATNLWRESGNHSCTPGYNGNTGMCIGTQSTCSVNDYDPSWALKFEITLNPAEIGQLTNLRFHEKAPTYYDWIGGDSGLNNYTTKYLIRVYKNNQLIYSQNDIASESEWNLENFNFSSNPNFEITSTSTFRFELRPYCRIGNGAAQSVWDIDNIIIKGCAGSVVSNCEITPTISDVLCDDNDTPVTDTDDTFSFNLTIEGNECSSPDGWQTLINGTLVSGDYGTSTYFSGYPISGGSLTFDIQDKDTAGCEESITVNPPASTCSDGGIDLELTKTASVAEATVGDQFTYSLTLENKGVDDATGVTVEVNPPVGLTFISSNASMGSYSDATKTWTVGTVLNGETKTLDIVVEVVSIDAPITCFAQVETASPEDVDSTPGNDNDQTPNEDDEDDATVSPIPLVDLELTKTASVAEATVGDQFTYSLTLENKGVDDATGVTVEVNPPVGLTFISSNASMGSYSDATKTWTVGTVLNGETKTLDIVVEVVSIDAPITCFAQVETASPEDVDSTPGNDNDQTPNEDDEDDATVSPIPLVDLELTKTASVTEATAGGQFTYSLTLENKGPADATGVTVEVNPPAGLTFISSNASMGSYSDPAKTWTVGTVLNGETKTLDIVVEVVSIDAPITCFAQVETASPNDIDSTPGNDNDQTPNEDDEDDATVSPTPLVDLELTKTASVTEATAGDQFTYSLTLENKGPADATGVTIEVNPPAGLTFISSNASMGTYSDATKTWTVGTVLNGETKTLDIVVEVVSIDAPITCFAQVETASPNDIDSTPGNDNDQTPNEDDEDDATVSPTPLVDLELTKTASVTEATAGGQFTYSLTLENKGHADATGVTVEVNPPVGLTFISSNASMGTYSDATKTWTVGTVLNGETKTLDIVVEVVSIDAPITCFAQVETASPDDVDSTPGNDNDQTPNEDDEDDVTITPVPVGTGIDLELTKTVDNPVLNKFTNRTFTITVINKGPETATNVSVKDAIPAGLAFTNSSASKGSYSVWAGIWTIGSLAPNESATLDLTLFILNVDTPITNFAQVQTADPDDIDSTPGNDTDNTPDEDDEDEATITPEGFEPTVDLELTKTASVNQASVGDQFTYTLTLENKGPADATGVTVEVNSPAGLTFISSNPSMGTYSDATKTWTVGAVANGETKTLDIVVEVVSIDAPITCFAQVETASPDDSDSTPGNDNNQTPNEDDEDDVTVTPASTPMVDLELTKTASVIEALVGDQFTYTLTLENKGPADATGVTVEVNPPAGLTFISSNPSMGTYSDATKTWTVGAVANGETKTLDIVVEVVSIDAPITCFAQVETASPDDVDSTPGNDNNQTPNEDDEDDVTVTPASTPMVDLELTKTASVIEASVGDQFTYTLTLENKGPADATGVTVEVNPPAGLTFISSNPSMGTYSDATKTWAVGAVANGETKTLDIVVEVVSIDAPITCFAQVETASPDDIDSTPGNDNNQTPNEDDEDDVIVTPASTPMVDLELTKTASVTEASVGDQFTYTLTLENKGPTDATGVTVEVNPPAGLTFISSNPSMGTYSDATKTWTVGAVANGETKTLDIVVEVVSIDAPIICFAQVETASPDDVDSTPGNDNNQTPNEDDEDDVTVTPAPIGGDGVDLELTKTVDNPLLVKYSHRTFTVTVINKGTETANNVTVKDVLPAGLAYTNHTTSKGTYSVWGGTWTIGNLAPNESVSFDLTLFILDDSAPITNFAQVQTASPDDIDSTPGNDTDNTPDEDDEDEATLSSDVIVTDNIDLELSKNANVVDAGVGDEIIYTLVLNNNGTINATGVLVEDLLPSGLSYVSSNPSKGSYNNGSGIWNVGTVAVGETVTLTITTTVLIINESITNFAQVEAANEDDTDSTPDNDSNNTPNEDDEDNAIVYAPITCDNVTEAGSIGYAESECGPYDPDPIVSVELPSGGTGALEYLWFKSTIGTTFYTNSPDWTAVPNSNSASIDPVSITETTYYIRCSRRFGCYNYPGESNVVVKTVEDCGGNDTDIDLEVEISADSSSPSLFSNVTFTVTVTNNSTVTATGVELDIPIPVGMAYTNKILSQGNYNLWTQVWDVDLLAGGTSATLDLVLFVLNLDNPVTTFAQVTKADQTDMDSTPNNNNTTTPVEDDEAAATVSLAGSSGGKGSLADGPIDRATTLVLQDLFPIPTNDRLNVLFETAGFQVNLFLYDVNGKMLSKRSLRVAQGENAIQLETGHLPAGFYTISLHTPEGYVRGKFVKQ